MTTIINNYIIFIIGNNIVAGASNYLYVNNLSSTGNVETFGDIIT
jgi:hypothetical protein